MDGRGLVKCTWKMQYGYKQQTGEYFIPIRFIVYGRWRLRESPRVIILRSDLFSHKNSGMKIWDLFREMDRGELETKI